MNNDLAERCSENGGFWFWIFFTCNKHRLRQYHSLHADSTCTVIVDFCLTLINSKWSLLYGETPERQSFTTNCSQYIGTRRAQLQQCSCWQFGWQLHAHCRVAHVLMFFFWPKWQSSNYMTLSGTGWWGSDSKRRRNAVVNNLWRAAEKK